MMQRCQSRRESSSYRIVEQTCVWFGKLLEIAGGIVSVSYLIHVYYAKYQHYPSQNKDLLDSSIFLLYI